MYFLSKKQKQPLKTGCALFSLFFKTFFVLFFNKIFGLKAGEDNVYQVSNNWNGIQSLYLPNGKSDIVRNVMVDIRHNIVESVFA